MFELLLLLGIAGLIAGANLIIKGALNIAWHLKLSHIFIGLTILALGTDLPELVIDINAAVEKLGGTDTSGFIVGETTGTCMAQIALTLGIVGLFGTSFFLTKKEILREGLIVILSVLIFFLLSLDGELSRWDGFLMILIYITYFLFLYKGEKSKERDVKKRPSLELAWSILSLILGFAILIYSSEVVVDNALNIAKKWGVAQSFVGAIIVGLGTSMPEIIISFGGVIKKVPRLSIGNILGSNIFDILFTLGIGSSISGFFVEKKILLFDIPYLFFTSVFAIILFITGKKLSKSEAGIILCIYIIYLVIKILNFEGIVIDNFSKLFT
ncbi:hypothetical protein GF354_02930 [Candidatus Peregrinibacteria bacterium]|nr:hypothetical protein [Candidatus Peregrinibacteria bacterium]